MRLRDVLEQPGARLPVLAGQADLDRPLTRAYTTDLLDPSRYLAGGEMVLTGLMWRREPADSERFVAALANAGVAALGAGEALLGPVPRDLIDACLRHRVPLFAVPEEVSFREVTDRINTILWAEREATALAARSRQQGLVAALAAGAELAEVWPPDTEAWVLTATGRVIAGGPLAVAPRLAAAFLRADTLPARCTIAGREFRIDRITGAPRLGARFVASADGADPDELIPIASLDQARQDRAQQVERRLAARLVEVVAAAAEPAQLNSSLQACGLSPQDQHVVLVASLTDGQSAAAMLEEIVGPARAAVAEAGDQAVAFVAATGPELLAVVRDLTRQLAAASRGTRFTIGISQAVSAATGLPAALIEAQHAHAYALGQPGRASVVSCDELASHDLLLATVPAGARRAFADRLLQPLLAYDASHNADLVHTLRAFLECDGSWTRCANTMHLHVNTLRYRIQRIAALTGRDLDHFADRVDFYLALRLHRHDGTVVFEHAQRHRG